MVFVLSILEVSLTNEYGAALCGSLGCVTLHAVGFGVEPITIMPHARGKAPIEHDQPGTRQSERPLTKTVVLLASRPAISPATFPLSRSEHDASRDLPGFREAPERDQQLARHCHNSNPAGSALQLTNALAEPGRELTGRLITQP